MIMRVPIHGQCYCGHIQFELRAQPDSACHCHCEDCQRASGAAFMTWAAFPSTAFEITKGELVERQSSPGVTRGHCGQCGTAMTWASEKEPDEIDIAVTCIDQPGTIRPESHIFIEDKQPWVVIGDDLPQHDRWAPEE